MKRHQLCSPKNGSVDNVDKNKITVNTMRRDHLACKWISDNLATTAGGTADLRAEWILPSYSNTQSVVVPPNWSQFFFFLLLLLLDKLWQGDAYLNPQYQASQLFSLLLVLSALLPLRASLLALSLFISCQIICVALCIFFGASYRTLYGIRSSFRVVFFLLLDVLCHIW